MRFFKKLRHRILKGKLRRVILDILPKFGCTGLRNGALVKRLLNLRPAIRQQYRRMYELPSLQQLKGKFGEPIIVKKPDQ